MTSKALDLFRFASSTFEDEDAAPMPAPHQRHPRKSLPKTFRKPSNVPPMKGTSILSCSIPFYFLCLLYLTFVLSAGDFRLVGVSADGSAKESGHQEVCTTKSPSSREPLANPRSITPRNTDVLDIALVSGHTGTINHDAICGPLAKCLQDVSSAMFTMPYWVFNFSLLLY
jgi:hypothetical protein